MNEKDDKTRVKSDLEEVEKNWKVLTKQVKEKDKEIYDLKKENKFISDNLTELKTNFSNLTATVNKEKKKEEKKQKKRESKEFMDSLKDDSKELQFQCNFCDVKCESQLKLQKHVRFFHMSSSSSQTHEIKTCAQELNINQNVKIKEEVLKDKEYEKYPCFYCEKEITSEQHMLEHKVRCHGATEIPSLFSLPIRSWP